MSTPTDETTAHEAARALAEALGRMFDDYPMASPQASHDPGHHRRRGNNSRLTPTPHSSRG